MNPSLYAKLSLVIAAMVLLVGATVASDYLGKNKGQFAAIGTPSCYSDAQIATLNAEKVAIETNIASTTAEYTKASSEITRLTALLTPTATVTTKYTEAQGYKAYITPYYKKNNTKLWTANFNKYNVANTAYNTMVANNTSYSAQITTNTNNKTAYQNSLTTLNAELTAKNAEIATANGKKCSSASTSVVTASTYVPDTGSHLPCSMDDECSTAEHCVLGACVTIGSNQCLNDAGCNAGDTCEAGACTSAGTPIEVTEICDDVGLVDEDKNGSANCDDSFNCRDESICCYDTPHDNDSDGLIDGLDPDCRGDTVVETACTDVITHLDALYNDLKEQLSYLSSWQNRSLQNIQDAFRLDAEEALEFKQENIAQEQKDYDGICAEYNKYLKDLPDGLYRCPGVEIRSGDPCS